MIACNSVTEYLLVYYRPKIVAVIVSQDKMETMKINAVKHNIKKKSYQRVLEMHLINIVYEIYE